MMRNEDIFLQRAEGLRVVATTLFGEYSYNSGRLFANTKEDFTDIANKDKKSANHMYNILMLLDQVTKEFQMAQGRKFEDEE